MGQINSVQCSYHYLRTHHSEEGYCALCNERFSNLRGRDRLEDELEECPCYTCTSKKSQSDDSTSPESSRRARLYPLEADQIHKCGQCPRFFYSVNQLAEHAEMSRAGHNWNARFNNASEPSPNDIYRHRRRILDCLDASLLHIKCPEISRKDLETERQHVCCVRCGVYFNSKEQKRKHFRDVEDYIMRVGAVEPSVWDDANTVHGDDDQLDSGYPSASLFPLPPSTVISNPIQSFLPPQTNLTSTNPRPQASFPASVSHSSPYIPELRAGFCEVRRVPPLAARFGTTFTSSVPGTILSKPAAKEVRIPDDFECPLCLDNERDVSALPCGHIFGTECIRKTLDSDPRCPLCRRPAERSSLKRLQSA